MEAVLRPNHRQFPRHPSRQFSGSRLIGVYRAILQSSTFVEFIGDLEKLPPARITLTDYPSFRLAASLGIPVGEPLTPISQYHLECSFGFGDTITLFANDRPWWWW
jgi:hypothetical protein